MNGVREGEDDGAFVDVCHSLHDLFREGILQQNELTTRQCGGHADLQCAETEKSGRLDIIDDVYQVGQCGALIIRACKD